MLVDSGVNMYILSKQTKSVIQVVLLQVLLKSSITFSTAIYASAAILAAIGCILLPIETSGKELTDKLDEKRETKVTKF